MVLEQNRDMVLQRLMECLGRDRTKHQVAEVTSLGLVQMTRKKLGLGLLETFSEACDVCGGRGVVVHHEPVSRGRHSEPSSGKKRKATPPATQPIQTHQITEDARNAIAQIAKSTVGIAAKAEITGADAKPARKKRAGTISTEEMPAILDSVLNALPDPPEQGSSKRRRRASSRDV